MITTRIGMLFQPKLLEAMLGLQHDVIQPSFNQGAVFVAAGHPVILYNQMSRGDYMLIRSQYNGGYAWVTSEDCLFSGSDQQSVGRTTFVPHATDLPNPVVTHPIIVQDVVRPHVTERTIRMYHFVE